MSSSRCLIALAAFSSLAKAVPHPMETRGTIATNNASAPSSKYELVSSYTGSSFFDHFTTYTGPDPTHGFVNYTDMAFAAEEGLIGFVSHTDSNTTTAYIGVDHTNVAPNGRNSVRLLSKETFNAGSMAVIDLNHIPSQYGLWPAIWMLGTQDTWPASGESDILEYVHKTDYNAVTLHTSPGCSVSNSTSFQGRILNTDCNTGNAATGCSVDAYEQNKLARKTSSNKTHMATAGAPFNAQGGGVYVHDWQEDGITVWLFPHSALPADLVAGKPNPPSWTQQPLAKFSGACDFSTTFRDMQLIINIDFGGDWAGRVWESSGSANATGCATANEYVANNPKAFEDAYFDVASIKFFTNNGQKPGNFSSAKRDVQVPSLMTRAKDRGDAVVGNLTLTRGSLKAEPETSDASAREASAWLAAAGMFILVAFLV